MLGIDETPCPLICPELPHIRSAYLYAQYGDSAHPYDCYYFASRKTRENIQAILGNYHGYLQSDACICYELIAVASDNPSAPGLLGPRPSLAPIRSPTVSNHDQSRSTLP